ncbi:nif-specific transcriptional activator NifA [Telmatospirillum sp.]|uniref:nif-specific transcriptional activator NifA n=1 Tax=Telmatospirillum sp. TaxID=2079197 RepID=UPI00284E6D46|nr:nif-specific transcriptional activator NifA [Telmatospirillum sp.]MDR3437067.1 nif-specific transcriptional activator NifA [Telmatospirillum sp.]
MHREPPNDSALPLIGIYEISKILGATLDLDKALHDVLNVLSSFLQLRHGAVVLADAEENVSLAAVSGMSLRMARSGALKYPFEAVSKVISTGIPMVVPEASEDPLLADYVAACDIVEDEDISFFCVPIKGNGKPFGTLSVERSWNADSRYVFEHDLRFLTMIATLIGQTVSLHRKVAADRDRLMQHNARLAKQMAEIKPTQPIKGLEDIIANSEPMARVFSQVQQAAPTKATILLRGESGTGKELVARAVHLLSPRSQKPLIKLNCATLSETMLESELFGHEKGAFTGAIAERKGRFELAHEGTLFLDEIGEISANFQAKLLRVLQEGEFERVGGSKTIKVDVRLVAATNRDLETAVSRNEFRADLYYRLNVVPIFLPPLRERPGDIPLLALYFLKRFNEENGRQVRFSEEALKVLQRCYFPGNVRELENCVYRTATMTKGDAINDMDLSCRSDTCLSSILWNKRNADTGSETSPTTLPMAAPVAKPVRGPVEALADDDVTMATDMSERDRLVEAMEKCGWVQAKAARLLGLTSRQIGYALRKHNIELRKL